MSEQAIDQTFTKHTDETFLHGLKLSEDIQLNNADIQIKKKLTDAVEIKRLTDIHIELPYCDSILVINSPKYSAQSIVLILRLCTNKGIWFRHGLISNYTYSRNGGSGSQGLGGSLEGYDITGVSIEKSESNILQSRIDELLKYSDTNSIFKNLITSENSSDTPDLQLLKQAFEFYNDALLSKKIEDKISKVIFGLEIIYGDGGGELSYKLRKRTAKFLSFFDNDVLDIRNKVKLGYDIRSKYIHEGKINPDKIDENIKLFEFLAELLKKSILFFCEWIYKKNTKKQLIQSIDELLITSKSNRLNETVIELAVKLLKNIRTASLTKIS